MAKLISASINLTKIPKDKIIDGKTGKWIPLTISLNDELDQFENDCSISIQQSKEERDAKTKKVYVGNGKVVWTDEKESVKQIEVTVEKDDDLPF